MWAYRALRVDVKNFVAMRHQPIRDDHAMTAEIHALGAHIRGARDAGDLEQFGGSLLELGRQRVVGIVAEAGIAQRRMRRVFACRLAIPAKLFGPDVSDALLGQRMLQRLTIKVRQAARHGEGADIHQRLNVVRLQG